MNRPTTTPTRRRPDVERLARVLDELIPIPGTRIRVGLDSLLGLLPAGGDVAAGLLSTWIIVVAMRAGAPPAVLLRMGSNVLLDTLVGAVPLLGDLFDVAFKANRRNVDLLGKYLDTPRPVTTRSRVVLGLVVLTILLALAFVVVALVQLIGLVF